MNQFPTLSPHASPYSFAQVVRLYRQSRGLSLRAFADELNATKLFNITHTTIDHWEKGLRTPHQTYLLPLALYAQGWPNQFGLDAVMTLSATYDPEKHAGNVSIFIQTAQPEPDLAIRN